MYSCRRLLKLNCSTQSLLQFSINVCLFIYVMTYQEESNEKKAVMVFIHGGAFNFGSGAVKDHSPDYLLDENVIVVTINYRLNVFGRRIYDR